MRSDVTKVPFSTAVKVNPRDTPLGGQVPYVAMQDVSEEGRLLRVTSRSRSDVAPSQPTFRDQDILFAKITPCMENGKGALVQGLGNAIGHGSTEFHVLRPTAQALPGFVQHWTQLKLFRAAAEGTMTGSGGQRRVPASFFRSFQIRLPNLTEQQRIVEILDSVAETEQALQKLVAKLKSTHLATVLTTIPTENYTSPDWLRVALHEVVPTVQYGISSPLSRDSSGTPTLRMNNVQEGEIDLQDLRFTNHQVKDDLLLEKGDLLFNRTNSIDHVGKACIWRGEISRLTFASYLVKLNIDRTRIDSEYLLQWLLHPGTRQRIRSIATVAVQQVNVNPTRLRELPINFPTDIGTQRDIAATLRSIDDEINKSRSELTKLRKLREGLAEDLLSGRVSVDSVD